MALRSGRGRFFVAPSHQSSRLTSWLGRPRAIADVSDTPNSLDEPAFHLIPRGIDIPRSRILMLPEFVIAVGNLIEKPRHLGEDSIRLARMVNLMAG
jgi:hypothetical protein